MSRDVKETLAILWSVAGIFLFSVVMIALISPTTQSREYPTIKTHEDGYVEYIWANGTSEIVCIPGEICEN